MEFIVVAGALKGFEARLDAIHGSLKGASRFLKARD
jgi:hypothetical protein